MPVSVVTEGTVEASHDHPPDGRCLPGCPGWAEGVLGLYALQRRYAEMLESCRDSEGLEYILVAPGAPGVELPAHLQEEDIVRVNLVVGRDCPEVLLDEWGIRCTLTFRGRRHACAFPWPSVLSGGLRPSARKPMRFGVIQGGKKD
jgi:hypothetical protein